MTGLKDYKEVSMATEAYNTVVNVWDGPPNFHMQKVMYSNRLFCRHKVQNPQIFN